MKAGWVCESTKPEDDFARTVNLSELAAVLLEPGIAQRVFAFAHGNNLASETKQGSVFDDAEFFELRSTAWAGLVVAQGE